MDTLIREELITAGIVPMKGIHACINADSKSIWYAEHNKMIQNSLVLYHFTKSSNSITLLNELEGKQMLSNSGVKTPSYGSVTDPLIKKLPENLNFPLVVKMISRNLSHKAEAGVIMLIIEVIDSLNQAFKEIIDSIQSNSPAALTNEFLLEEQFKSPIDELLINI